MNKKYVVRLTTQERADLEGLVRRGKAQAYKIRHAHVLYVMYCLDNLCYLSTTCLTTYLQKIAAPEDLMPTLSMGVTMNHIAAVLVPLIGGYLWASLGYPVTFKGGAIVVFISFLLASRVGRKRFNRG